MFLQEPLGVISEKQALRALAIELKLKQNKTKNIQNISTDILPALLIWKKGLGSSNMAELLCLQLMSTWEYLVLVGVPMEGNQN